MNAHIVSLGGEVKSDTAFDPFKSAVSSTNYNKMPTPNEKDLVNKYDPTIMTEEI